jgi:hypothetical protein
MMAVVCPRDQDTVRREMPVEAARIVDGFNPGGGLGEQVDGLTKAEVHSSVQKLG